MQGLNEEIYFSAYNALIMKNNMVIPAGFEPATS